MSLVVAVPVALVLTAVLCAFGAPRLWLCGIAAVILPQGAAFFVSIVGALAGHGLLFAACRTPAAQRVVDRIVRCGPAALGRLPRLRAGISGVVLLRQAPGPGAVATVLLARGGVSMRDFLIGSFIGFLPTTALTVLLAGNAASRLPADILAWTTAAMALAAAAVWFIRARLDRRRGGS